MDHPKPRPFYALPFLTSSCDLRYTFLFFSVSPNPMPWLIYRGRLGIDKVFWCWWYEWGKGGSKARHVGDKCFVEAWRNPGQKDGTLFSRCLPGNWLVSYECESPSRQRLSNKKSQGTNKTHVNWESRWMPFDSLRGFSEFLKSSGACQGPCPGLIAYWLWWWRTKQTWVQGSNSNIHYCVNGAHASTKKWLTVWNWDWAGSLAWSGNTSTPFKSQPLPPTWDKPWIILKSGI